MVIQDSKIDWQHLGTIPYRRAWSLQDELREKRIAGEIGDCLLILEHPRVITLGKRECDGDILSPKDVIESEGIEIVKTNRGGRATYHGPGQLIGYFICALDGFGMGIRDFVHSVEEMCIATLSAFDVRSTRDEEHPGLWVGRNKIVAIGMNVSRGVTQHGFAMNVNCDLGAYRHIVACGINDGGVTSIERELNRAPSLREVSKKLVAQTGEVFKREMKRIELLIMPQSIGCSGVGTHYSLYLS